MTKFCAPSQTKTIACHCCCVGSPSSCAAHSKAPQLTSGRPRRGSTRWRRRYAMKSSASAPHGQTRPRSSLTQHAHSAISTREPIFTRRCNRIRPCSRRVAPPQPRSLKLPRRRLRRRRIRQEAALIHPRRTKPMAWTRVPNHRRSTCSMIGIRT